jgi:hypothetical protein
LAVSSLCGFCGYRAAVNKSGQFVCHGINGSEIKSGYGGSFACPGSNRIPLWLCPFCGLFAPTRESSIQEVKYKDHCAERGDPRSTTAPPCQGGGKLVSAKCDECGTIVELMYSTFKLGTHGADGSTGILKHLFGGYEYCKGGNQPNKFPNRMPSTHLGY